MIRICTLCNKTFDNAKIYNDHGCAVEEVVILASSVEENLKDRIKVLEDKIIELTPESEDTEESTYTKSKTRK